jgi:DNA-binding FadR family transcriptional regulator
VIVESEAAALAAQNARPADVERLRAVLGRMAETLDDPQAYARLDLEFHRNTVEISGNRFLLLLFDALAPHVLRFLSAFVAVGGDRRAAVDRHWPLLQAIADRDAEAARALARTHSETARRDIEAAVRKPPRLRPGKRSRPTARRAR